MGQKKGTVSTRFMLVMIFSPFIVVVAMGVADIIW